MPEIKDLLSIKEKIKNIGNEQEILKGKELPYNETLLPGEKPAEKKVKPEKKEEDLLDIGSGAGPAEEEMEPGTEENLDNILDSIGSGKTSEKEEDINLEGLNDLITGESSDTGTTDDFLSSILEPSDSDKASAAEKNEEPAEEEKESKLDLAGFDELENILDEPEGSKEETAAIETPGDTSDVDELLKGIIEEGPNEEIPSDFESIIDESKIEAPPVKDNDELGGLAEKGDELLDLEADFKDLAGEGLTGKHDEILEQIGNENIGEGEGLESREAINEILDEKQAEEKTGGLDNELAEENELLKGFSPEEIAEEGKKGEGSEGELFEGIESLDELKSESLSGEPGKDLSSELKDMEDFDFQKIDETGKEEIKPPFDEDLEQVSFDIEEKVKAKIPEKEAKGVKPGFFGKIPDELSPEEIKANEDIEIKLNDNDRKKIILTLRNLPKEAEIKIAKAIAGGKYSNSLLKPLIEALIDNEAPYKIISLFEKITGDRSLRTLEIVKISGEKYEEKLKSVSYLIQKNLLPILSKITAGAAVLVGIMLLVVFLLLPTIRATGYYNQGKKQIENKIFWEAEKSFGKAFEIQPRYKEVVDYARLYRKYKRYLEAETKYELASNLKPVDKNLVLEYGDFYRETREFDRAEKKYNSVLRNNGKDIDALLGLARTYVDWSEDTPLKINDAKELYYNVLSIDKKNKEAVYGNLSIFLKENNQKEILKYYSFIDKTLKKTDPESYASLAEYFINNNMLDNVKDILGKAARSMKKSMILPQINYQFARYNKVLNSYSDELTYLKRAEQDFVKMSANDAERYQSKKYQRLLANVYNDLGENYDRTEKVSTSAEHYYLKALQADPSFGKAYFNIATFALKNKPDGYIEAKNNYLEAEKNGFTSDQLNFNLGWLYYKEKDYKDSFVRINSILDGQPDNTNLKYMLGTIFYRLGNYELSESLLLETYDHFDDLFQKFSEADTMNVDHMMNVVNMIKKVSNNLGAAYQKKYETTRNSKYLIRATKYYSDSVNFFDKTYNNQFITEGDEETAAQQQAPVIDTKFKKENANINLRMVLFPYAGVEEPFIYEDFPLDFKTFL